MADCLLNLVGVTDKTDIPFYADLDAELQEDIAVSSSGHFMDRLTGGIDLMSVDNAEYMALVLKLSLDAKTEASRILNDELLIAINNRFHPSKTKFNGFIGRRTYSATSSTASNLQGHRYRMLNPIAGLITINSIAVNVNGAGTFKVYVDRCNSWDSEIAETLYEFPVTSIAGNWVNADMSSQQGQIILHMEIEGEPQEYYIYWKRDESGGLSPKNNDMKCYTCGNKRQMYALEEFMLFNGIAFGSTSQLRNVNLDRLGHGLSVAAVVGCDHSEIICREYNKKEAVKLMMDKAAQYKAGELWIEYVMKSGYVNRDNMQNREYMWGKRNNFRKEFDERITSIANAMELAETHCYQCKDNIMQKGTIYS